MAELSEKEFDVIGFAKKIMSEVESIRSFEKLTDDATGEGFQLPTETRVDAFFRLIGLPYFVVITDAESNKEDDVKFLNPGFGASVRSTLADKTIKDNPKQEYQSPSGQSGKSGLIVQDRKNELKSISVQIGNSDMNQRMGKAICSPADIKSNIPADKLIGSGTFIPKLPPRGGPDTENKREIFKKLFPLIPSYQKVLPLRNEVARPFTLSTKERRLDRDTVLRKPFIEQVVRTRFVVYGSAQKAKEKETETDITKSIKQLVGDDEFSEIFKDGKLFSQVNRLEEFVIGKLLNAIKNLARRWVKINEQRVRLLREISPTIAIKTSSARISAFGKRIEVSTTLDGTKEGEKIKKLNASIATEEALLLLLPTDENEETDPKQSDTRNVTPSALQNSFTELLNYNLKKNKEARSSLVSKSKRNINSLERIRLELDLMTGEFSGLSLPDVVFTIAGLFIMKRESLLDLLDKYTIDFMKTDSVLKTVVDGKDPQPSTAMAAVNELESVIEKLFTLFQTEVEAVQNRKTQGRKAKSIRKSDDKATRPPPCAVSKKETS